VPEPLESADGAVSARPNARVEAGSADLIQLQHSAGNAAVARLVRGRAAQPQVQRYQAGEEGHGGIEAEALGPGPGGAGLSADEARQVYMGNWMRDLSQLNSPAMLPIIRILAAGEFGQVMEPSALGDQLGQYVPSEHLDNPEGGDTVEDPRASPERRQELYNQLSPDQRVAFDAEEQHAHDILDASARSGLPVYIERGKMHSKEKLKEAIGKGRGPEGFALMGDALHAIEDYYSHSNFTEACIMELEAAGDPMGVLLGARVKQTTLGGNPAMLVPHDAGGRAQIQTGTYAGDANKWVSRLELIQTELTNGELTRSFIKGWILVNQVAAEEVLSRILSAGGGAVGSVLGGLIGGVGGAVSGAATGALSGAAGGAESGWEAGERAGGGGILGAVLGGAAALGGGIAGGITGFFGGGARGAVSGAEQGSQTGAAIGSRAGAAVGNAAGLAVGTILAATETAVLLAAFAPLILPVVIAAFAAAKTGLLEKIAQHETSVSGGEARSAGLSGPTHSELAKDDPEHPLFDISRRLAVAADHEIGEAMIAAWAGTVHTTTDAARPLPPAGAPGGRGGGGAGANGAGSNGHSHGNGHRSKKELYAEVDKRFWARYPNRAGKKLKTDDPDDQPYIAEWVKIRHEVEQEKPGQEQPGTVGGMAGAEHALERDIGAFAGADLSTPEGAMTAQVAGLGMSVDLAEMQAMTGEAAANERYGEADTPEEKAVLDLVDKYVCHPDQSDWWKAVIHGGP
jgi:hypothetical protein